MVDFSTPFADLGDKNAPDTDTAQNGFPDGAADKTLFNWLFHSLQAEMGEVISFAGLTGDNSDLAQLRKAIQELINNAVGSDTSLLLSLSQAAARLPIFPEIQTADHKIAVTTPGAGQITIPAGVNIMHRGVQLLTTAEETINLDASKTYHLRWAPNGSSEGAFTVNDLSDGTVYNTGALDEDNAVFDSTYDDMLVARITTTAANAVTITPLKNAHQLWEKYIINGADVRGATRNAANFIVKQTYDWARTPTMSSLIFTKVWTDGPDTDIQYLPNTFTSEQRDAGTLNSGDDGDLRLNRYELNNLIMRDHATEIQMRLNIGM
ncbi:MAG: hypothetical protein AAF220_01720 [Pseudomonadota bacterium]